MEGGRSDACLADIGELLRACGCWEGRSGSVFFSTEDTFRPGLFYFLGLNPGGTPDDANPAEWICNNLFPSSKVNAFYENWYTDKVEEHPLQKNVKRFLGSLQAADKRYEGKPPDAFIKSVCCSNICFVRTPTSKSAPEKETFWAIHERIINAKVRPSCILINGITGYRRFKSKLTGMTGQDKIHTGASVGGREQMVHFALFGADKLLVGIPHLSSVRPYHKATDMDNREWVDKGLPKLLRRCQSAVDKRPAEGCTWTFRQ